MCITYTDGSTYWLISECSKDFSRDNIRSEDISCYQKETLGNEKVDELELKFVRVRNREQNGGFLQRKHFWDERKLTLSNLDV